MQRSAVLVTALLLLLAAPVAGLGGHVVGPPGTPSDANGTGSTVGSIGPGATRVLALDGPNRSAFAETPTTATASISIAGAGLDGAFATQRFDARWQAAPNDTARLAIARNATARVANRTDALVGDEANARDAFAAGRLSATALLRRLALDGSRAQSLSAYLDDVRSHLDGLPADDAAAVSARVARLRAHLAAFDFGTGGGVRQHLAAAVAGDRSGMHVYVATSADGLVVSTLANGVYTRVAYRLDAYDGATGGTSLTTFSNSLQRRYPVTWNRSPSRKVRGWTGNAYYRAVLGYGRNTESTLVVYFDPSTNAVYRENRRVHLGDVVPGPGVTRTVNDTTLVVNRTYPGGPLRVAATNATGAPLSVPVTVNGTSIGTTDASGAAWTLSPAGDYTVRVTRNGTTVSLNATALRPTTGS